MSRASRTPLQESARRLVTSVIFGERSSVLWGKQNPDGSWERTSQDSLALNLEPSSGEYSMTWPKWGTAWDGRATELVMSERFTAATESSSLGTPAANDSKNSLTESQRGRGTLTAGLLPTPQAWDAKDFHAANPVHVKTREQQKARGGGCANLAERMAAQMLPAPATSQMGKPIRPLAPSEADGSRGTMLVAAFNLPTPRSCSAMGAAINPNAEFPNLETVIAQSVAETGESGESAQRLGLNPEFVEAMQGFPPTWTELTG